MSSMAHLNPVGKVLYGLLSFFPWDRFYCCFDFCFQVMNILGAVGIDFVLNISPKIKNLSLKSGEYGNHCGSHLRLISRSEKRFFNHANDSFEVCGVQLSC